MSLSEYKEYLGLLIFGNIENLVLSSQGVIKGLDPLIVAALSLIAVVLWLCIGTFGTKIAIKYSRVITFIGGLAILILGVQSMLQAIGIL